MLMGRELRCDNDHTSILRSHTICENTKHFHPHFVEWFSEKSHISHTMCSGSILRSEDFQCNFKSISFLIYFSLQCAMQLKFPLDIASQSQTIHISIKSRSNILDDVF